MTCMAVRHHTSLLGPGSKYPAMYDSLVDAIVKSGNVKTPVRMPLRYVGDARAIAQSRIP